MLVVEGDHLAALGEAPQRLQIRVRADLDIRGDQRGAVVGRDGEHAQRLSERDRGLMGHAG